MYYFNYTDNNKVEKTFQTMAQSLAAAWRKFYAAVEDAKDVRCMNDNLPLADDTTYKRELFNNFVNVYHLVFAYSINVYLYNEKGNIDVQQLYHDFESKRSDTEKWYVTMYAFIQFLIREHNFNEVDGCKYAHCV